MTTEPSTNSEYESIQLDLGTELETQVAVGWLRLILTPPSASLLPANIDDLSASQLAGAVYAAIANEALLHAMRAALDCRTALDRTIDAPDSHAYDLPVRPE